MLITKQKFEQLVSEAQAALPEKFKSKLNNVAILVDDHPSQEQLEKIGLKNGHSLFGLFEGYCQAKRLNLGPVLPDRITIFRMAIIRCCSNEQEVRKKITNTVKHEIAHHFGSDEVGARRASR